MKKVIAVILLTSFMLSIFMTTSVSAKTAYSDSEFTAAQNTGSENEPQDAGCSAKDKDESNPIGATTNSYTIAPGDTQVLKVTNPYGSGFISSTSWKTSSSYFVSIISTDYNSCTIKANKVTSSSVTITCDFSVRIGSYPQMVLDCSQKFYITVKDNNSGGGGGGGTSNTQYVTVYFDANGGTVSPTSTKVVKYGYLSSTPRPTREGYLWTGWYLSPADNADELLGNKMFYTDTTVYAHWVKKDAISSVAVTGVTPPEEGMTPNFGAASANTSQYDVYTYYDTVDYHDGVKWYDKTNNRVMATTDKFIYGHRYTVYIYIQSDSYYYFPTLPTATINDLPAESAATSLSNYVIISRTFNCGDIKPTAPTLTLTSQDYGILASWNKVTDAEKYIVYYRKTTDTDWLTAETTGTSYALKDIDSGCYYYVKVLSIGTNNIQGEYSQIKSAKYVSKEKPVLTLSNTENAIRAEWTGVRSATRYVVSYKKNTASSWNTVGTVNNYYSIKGLTVGTSYAVKVMPVFGNDNGENSTIARLTYIPQIKPVLTLSNKSNGIRAEWTKVDSATKYTVYYKKDTDSSWSSATTENTYYPLLKLTAGEKYYVQVQPIFNTQKGAYSSVQSLIYAPQVKPALTISNKSNGIRAEWTKMNGASNYVVYFKKDTDSKWSSVEAENNFYPLLNLTAGARYAVQVLPKYNGANGLYSAVSWLVYIPQVKPAVTLSNKSNGIRAEWTKANGATKYVVYFRKDADKKWSSAVTANNYYPLLKLSAGTKYAVQVQPIFNGSKGLYSSVNRLVYIPQVKPTLKLSKKSNGIRAEWTKIGGATKYIVYYKKTSDSKWNSVATTNNYYPLLNLKAGATYFVQVQPVFGTQKGLYSAVSSQKY